MKNGKKVYGKESKVNVLNRLGLKPAAVVNMKYVMRNGVPHKMVDGTLVPLTKQQ